MRLADLPWPDVASRAANGAILAVPVGATEQHGPHLPLSTDTDIALALCDRLASARPDVLVAPALAFGSSGEHAGFAGTLSIGQAATELVLLELGRSAAETFTRLLFVSAHGGNAAPVARAVARLRAESRAVEVFQPRWEGTRTRDARKPRCSWPCGPRACGCPKRWPEIGGRWVRCCRCCGRAESAR